MTVGNQINKREGLGNGAGTSFSFSPMVIFEAANLEVTFVDTDGTETLLTEGSGAGQYTVVVADFPGTGSVTYPSTGSPMTTGQKITIKRVLTLEQQTDLENQGGYFPDILETALDKLVMQDLQQQEELDRAIKVAIGSDTDPATLASDLISAKDDAETAATNAAASETAAASSATDAGNSATSAAASLAAIGTSEANAAASAAAAALSETNASSSETNASASAVSATASASSATASQSAAATSASNAATSETNAAESETAAALSETNAASSEANAATSETNAAANGQLNTTSTTSVLIGAGTKTFVVADNRPFINGQFILAVRQADETAWMIGQVTAWTPGTLTLQLNVTDTNNSGTFTDWSITNTGPKGVDGAAIVNDNSITNAKLADVATDTIKGRTTAGSGDPEDLTAAQARAILNVADGAIANIVDDTTPQLGGELDGQGNATEDVAMKIATAKTGSFTFAAEEAGILTPCNSASAINATVPLNSSVAFSIGTTLAIWNQGAGLVTWVAEGGVTLNIDPALTLVSNGQHAVSFAIKVATNTWVVAGGLVAA